MSYFKKALFLFLCLLLASPFSYAQKWRTLKKALFPSRIQATSIKVQAQIERALSRAISAQITKPPHIRLVLEKSSMPVPELSLPTGYLLACSGPFPPFPFKPNNNEMYRGMVLESNGLALRHILKHGLEVNKSHYENFAAYNGIQYPEGTKAIYATLKPEIAMRFILADNDRVYLPIILHLKKVGWRDIVSIPHDIPPSWIRQVSTLLKVDGKLRWGELKLNKEGDFLFLPYPQTNVSSALAR